MGFSSKESDRNKFIIAGIPLRSPLKPILTTTEESIEEVDDQNSPSCTTPTTARIPEPLKCPPAPRKPRPVAKCQFNGPVEYFNPPDLDWESMFKCRAC